MWNKYAKLLVNYCVEVKKNERVLIRSSTLAEPLVREVYREVLKAGGHPHTLLEMRDENYINLTCSNDDQFNYVNPLFEKAMLEFDCYLFIRAPHNLMEIQNTDAGARSKSKKAKAAIMKRYFERTATKELKRNLCQYPTAANAQNAGMSLDEYRQFVFNACNLFSDDPVREWLGVREKQQKIVDVLNSRSKVHYKGEGVDIKFSTQDRIWINSDGQTNMPSGEVYTCPVEDSVNGTVHFSVPSVFMGKQVEGITLWVEDGLINKWEAKVGSEVLDEVFQIEGARRFGEAAIGTNNNIDRFTRNILFDEKIGGTIHMAVGQSYLQTGGKNQSAVHWDMITNMRNGGEIFADDEKIYDSGKFLFL